MYMGRYTFVPLDSTLLGERIYQVCFSYLPGTIYKQGFAAGFDPVLKFFLAESVHDSLGSGFLVRFPVFDL